MQEKIDIYDSFRNKTGIVKSRNQKLLSDEFRMVVHLSIFKDNKMLIQKRSSKKKSWKNKFDISVGGGVISSENSAMAIERELFEELGLIYDFSKKRESFILNFKNGFDVNYIINNDIDLDNIKIDGNEVSDVVFASKEEILKMIHDDLFVKYKPEVIELLFALKDKLTIYNE